MKGGTTKTGGKVDTSNVGGNIFTPTVGHNAIRGATSNAGGDTTTRDIGGTVDTLAEEQDSIRAGNYKAGGHATTHNVGGNVDTELVEQDDAQDDTTLATQEYVVDRKIDHDKSGRGVKHRVRWYRYGVEDDKYNAPSHIPQHFVARCWPPKKGKKMAHKMRPGLANKDMDKYPLLTIQPMRQHVKPSFSYHAYTTRTQVKFLNDGTGI